MTTTPGARTREEIEALKRSWLEDGTWDIEDTEGFEAHRDELVAFSRETEARVALEGMERSRLEIERLRKRAAAVGCTASTMQVIERVERDMAGLRGELDEMVAGLRGELDEMRAACGRRGKGG